MHVRVSGCACACVWVFMCVCERVNKGKKRVFLRKTQKLRGAKEQFYNKATTAGFHSFYTDRRDGY